MTDAPEDMKINIPPFGMRETTAWKRCSVPSTCTGEHQPDWPDIGGT